MGFICVLKCILSSKCNYFLALLLFALFENQNTAQLYARKNLSIDRFFVAEAGSIFVDYESFLLIQKSACLSQLTVLLYIHTIHYMHYDVNRYNLM